LRMDSGGKSALAPGRGGSRDALGADRALDPGMGRRHGRAGPRLSGLMRRARRTVPLCSAFPRKAGRRVSSATSARLLFRV
jgi:hypothetical protein